MVGLWVRSEDERPNQEEHSTEDNDKCAAELRGQHAAQSWGSGHHPTAYQGVPHGSGHQGPHHGPACQGPHLCQGQPKNKEQSDGFFSGVTQLHTMKNSSSVDRHSGAFTQCGSAPVCWVERVPKCLLRQH